MRLHAANHTEIDFSGEVTVPFKLGMLSLPIHMLVSDCITEVMLGIDFLSQRKCFWSFERKPITMDDTDYDLKCKSDHPWCRRVIVINDIDIPPRCEFIVPSKVVVHSLAPAAKCWASESAEVQPGLQVARVMIESEANHVPIRVLNVNEESINLEKRKTLGQLEPVQLIEEATTKEQEQYEEFIDELLSKVDTSVEESHKIELRKLLQGYQFILSTSEYDLGEVVDVRHTINTGDARPLRDAGRRHQINHQEVLDESR